MNKNTQNDDLSLATQRIAGTKKHIATTSSLAFAGATFARPSEELASLVEIHGDAPIFRYDPVRGPSSMSLPDDAALGMPDRRA